MGDDRWDIKVTSKGQITLPKGARNAMLVREGDRLEAVIQDDSLILRKRQQPTQADLIRQYARERLRASSLQPIDPRVLRERIGRLPVDLATLVREGREQR